jgi:hypothetical protein
MTRYAPYELFEPLTSLHLQILGLTAWAAAIAESFFGAGLTTDTSGAGKRLGIVGGVAY